MKKPAAQMKTNDPERIWLAPKCEEEEGRTWEWENIWPEGCKDCGNKAVEYVRADLAAAQVELLRAALERNRQGYANILENRKLKADVWGTRNGYGGRFGALTREEIEKELSSIDASLAATSASALAGLKQAVIEEFWDQHRMECGGCGVMFWTRDDKPLLCEPEGENLAVCGRCMQATPTQSLAAHDAEVRRKVLSAYGIPDMVCEKHPLLEWPHGECAGPGAPCLPMPKRDAEVRRKALEEAASVSEKWRQGIPALTEELRRIAVEGHDA